MTDAEKAFETVVARATADLPPYERAARQVLMLSWLQSRLHARGQQPGRNIARTSPSAVWRFTGAHSRAQASSAVKREQLEAIRLDAQKQLLELSAEKKSCCSPIATTSGEHWYCSSARFARPKKHSSAPRRLRERHQCRAAFCLPGKTSAPAKCRG